MCLIHNYRCTSAGSLCRCQQCSDQESRIGGLDTEGHSLQRPGQRIQPVILAKLSFFPSSNRIKMKWGAIRLTGMRFDSCFGVSGLKTVVKNKVERAANQANHPGFVAKAAPLLRSQPVSIRYKGANYPFLHDLKQQQQDDCRGIGKCGLCCLQWAGCCLLR